MAERTLGGDAVANRLLQLPQLGKTSGRTSIEDDLALEPHHEHTPDAPRHERHLAELRLERDEQLLGEPARSKSPTAARAVFDLDAGRAHEHSHSSSSNKMGRDETGRIGSGWIGTRRVR